MIDHMSMEQMQSIRARLKLTRAADVYDTLDQMGYPDQCLDIGIKPLSDKMVLSGPAITLMGTREPRRYPEMDDTFFSTFAFLDELYDGCVLVCNAEMGPSCMIGNWGEMMSYGARNKGAVGIVVDGGTRDKQGILDIEGWSCFARFSSPIESNLRWRSKAMNVPIFMSGSLRRIVRVDPGDWIFGDSDGVVVIPQVILEEVIDKVKELSEKEEITRKELASGVQLTEVFRKYKRA